MSKIRLDKLLSDSGIGSRSIVKDYVRHGLVSVDGKTASDAGMKIDTEKNRVICNGKEVAYQEFVYIMMNKPKGVISATDDPKSLERTVVDLLEPKYKTRKLFPVGRLDKDTTGLLILTDDGNYAHNTLSPKKHVAKVYYAEVRGVVNEADAEILENGVTLDDGYVCKSASLQILESGNVSKVKITITEGKFHQVKRMFEAVGKKVLELKRLEFGAIVLDPSLREGEYKEITLERF